MISSLWVVEDRSEQLKGISICKVTSSHCIMSIGSTVGEFQNELCRSPHAKLHPINPFGFIERLIISQKITGIMSPAYHYLNCSIVVCTTSSATIIHNNHLFMQSSIFNYDCWSNWVIVWRCPLWGGCIVTNNKVIDFSPHEFKSIGICIEKIVWSLDVPTVPIHGDVQTRCIFFNSFKVKVEFYLIESDIPIG